MKIFSTSLEKIALRAGLVTALGLIVYFLIMNQFGFSRVLWFRFLNFFILGAGIIYAINKFRYELTEDEKYLKGMGIGVYTAAVAVFTFAFFMSIFLAYFDTTLMAYIRSTLTMGEYLNAPAVFLIIFLEGMASGLIITFCAMQYYKSAALGSKQ